MVGCFCSALFWFVVDLFCGCGCVVLMLIATRFGCAVVVFVCGCVIWRCLAALVGGFVFVGTVSVAMVILFTLLLLLLHLIVVDWWFSYCTFSLDSVWWGICSGFCLFGVCCCIWLLVV